MFWMVRKNLLKFKCYTTLKMRWEYFKKSCYVYIIYYFTSQVTIVDVLFNTIKCHQLQSIWSRDRVDANYRDESYSFIVVNHVLICHRSHVWVRFVAHITLLRMWYNIIFLAMFSARTYIYIVYLCELKNRKSTSQKNKMFLGKRNRKLFKRRRVRIMKFWLFYTRILLFYLFYFLIVV